MDCAGIREIKELPYGSENIKGTTQNRLAQDLALGHAL